MRGERRESHKAEIGDGLELSRPANNVALGDRRRRAQDVTRDVAPDCENVHAERDCE